MRMFVKELAGDFGDTTITKPWTEVIDGRIASWISRELETVQRNPKDFEILGEVSGECVCWVIRQIGSGWRYAFWGATLAAFVIWWLIYFWQRTKPEDVGLAPIVGHEPEAAREVKASLEERLSFKKYSKCLKEFIPFRFRKMSL